MSTVNCPSCAMSLDSPPDLAGQTVACPQCNTQFVMPRSSAAPIPVYASPAYRPDIKNSGMAAVLSFIWTGLGQIYNGQIGKGVMLALVQFVFVMMSFVLIGLPFFLVLWVWGIYDAYQQAEDINSKARRR